MDGSESPCPARHPATRGSRQEADPNSDRPTQTNNCPRRSALRLAGPSVAQCAILGKLTGRRQDRRRVRHDDADTGPRRGHETHCAGFFEGMSALDIKKAHIAVRLTHMPVSHRPMVLAAHASASGYTPDAWATDTIVPVLSTSVVARLVVMSDRPPMTRTRRVLSTAAAQPL